MTDSTSRGPARPVRSTSPVRSTYSAYSIYAAFDDVALAALASRGLVRRGRAEVAAGHVEVRDAEAKANGGSVTVAVGRPPVPVVLTTDGPRDARCPCPVAGTCVHVVAACLWMREAVRAADPGADDPAGPDSVEGPAEAPGPSGPAEPSEPAEPSGAPGPAVPAPVPAQDPVLEEVLAWEPAAVEKALGAAALRRVTAALADADPARLAADLEITRAPGRLSVTWPDAPEVVVVAGLGPRDMIVAGRHSRVAHAAWRLQAVVRLFARAGRAWPWAARSATMTAGRRRLLASTARTIEGVIAAGISHAGPRSAHELDRLAQVARLEEVPRLARLLVSAAGAVHAVARRDDAIDESAALSALAAAWSLTRALDAAALDPALLGSAEVERTRPGLLVPLSAAWWTAPSGSRGLTARFWDLERRRLESVTTGRAAGADPAFRRSEDVPLVWGASVGVLLSGPLRLQDASRRADGTLAPSTRTTVSRCDGDGCRDDGGAGDGADGRYGCVGYDGYDGIDLAAVARELREFRRGPRAASFEPPSPPVRLLLTRSSGLGRIDLDEIHQQYVWPVRGIEGETRVLRLDPDGMEARLVADLLARNVPVVAMTVEGDRPTGIYVRDRGALALLSPSISSVRAGAPRFYRRLAERLERLRAGATAPAPIPDSVPVVESLCRDAHEALTALAASGGDLRPEGMTAHVLTTRARTARELRLETLAAALDGTGEDAGPRAVLRACAVVDRVRALAI